MNRFRKLFSDFDSLFSDFEFDFNQPIKMIGDVKTEKGQDSNGEWIKQTFTSKDGSYKMTTFYRTSGLSKENKTDLSTKIGDLKAELESCIDNQEFEKAAELRDKIKEIESNKEKVDALEKELEIAVKEQNFEKAIELRDKLKDLEK